MGIKRGVIESDKGTGTQDACDLVLKEVILAHNSE